MGNKRVPEVRFEGFSGEWEQRKLGDFTESYSGGTPSAGNKLYYGGSIPFIRSAEINSKSTELFITEDGLNNSSAKMVEKGVILYALYGATSGEVGIAKIHGAINQAILAIKPKFDDDSYFIIQWLKKQKSTIINTYLQGGQGNLSGSIVKDLIIPLPTNKDEQIQVGSFCKQLDDMIALHQQELTTLKQTKQGFLQKMFPKEGESVPEVRFPGFTGEWEQRKFKDFISKAGKKNTMGENYPAYSVSNKVGLVSQSEQFDGSRLDNLDKTSYKLVNPNEFAYNPARINVGSIAFNDLNKTVIVSSLYVILKMSEELDNEFILQFIKSQFFIDEVRKNTEGSVREYLFFENFKNIKFPYTSSKDEQTKIGNFFKQLDDTITLHQRELDALKETKKAFLQKMFV
ncbi:restriction endonuclease subunit S [Bacillus sp. KS1]|uniref:restriction endonuclease subunit S n=1 Tax=Bacillus sp. KS1 TaxID=2748045 RepID=UPI001CCE7611|nr:restriction endonuclease subunit S [Bacillus sp. KS1]MBZ5518232.1 restriction endonuclease subunit S [Bacillus sp. KS1]